MFNWWFIIALFIVGVLVVKARHVKHRFFAILLVLLVLFFYLTVPRVIQGHDVDLKTFDGIILTVRLYFAWLVHAFGNFQELTGKAVGMDWVGNQTG